MPQTILALLALMLLGQFSLGQQRDILHAQLAMINAEIATIGGAVATAHLERITTMAFDDATKEGSVLPSSAALTAPSAFRQDAPSDDVDDFHGSAVAVPRTTASDTLWFDVVTTVAYADETRPGTTSLQPTKLKTVEVTVHPRGIARADTVRLERLVACGSACAW